MTTDDSIAGLLYVGLQPDVSSLAKEQSNCCQPGVRDKLSLASELKTWSGSGLFLPSDQLRIWCKKCILKIVWLGEGLNSPLLLPMLCRDCHECWNVDTVTLSASACFLRLHLIEYPLFLGPSCLTISGFWSWTALHMTHALFVRRDIDHTRKDYF